MDISRPIVIFAYVSANVETTDEQDLAAAKAQLETHNLFGSSVTGAYFGVEEDSLLVRLNNWDEHKNVLEVAKAFDQESILVIDANRCASLVYTDGRPEQSLGEFYRVSEDIAKGESGWTRDGGNNYFITSKQAA